MEGRQICQWDKASCADAGFLKIDLLGLGMLSAVEECVDQIARHTGETIDLSRIPLDDPEVYAEIQDADTVGTFQIESRAQMQMLLRTRPRSLDDLTVEVALVRPGPIQGGAVHPYLARREGYDYADHSRQGARHGEFVDDETCDRFCILGSIEDHIAKLRTLEAQGVEQFNIYLMTGHREEILRAYGEHIIPLFKRET